MIFNLCKKLNYDRVSIGCLGSFHYYVIGQINLSEAETSSYSPCANHKMRSSGLTGVIKCIEGVCERDNIQWPVREYQNILF